MGLGKTVRPVRPDAPAAGGHSRADAVCATSRTAPRLAAPHGRQVQSVAFLYYLWQTQGIPGPFLVIAPLSTLPHWQREFERYVHEKRRRARFRLRSHGYTGPPTDAWSCRWTTMNVIVYHGNQQARDILVKHEFFYPVRAAVRDAWQKGRL